MIYAPEGPRPKAKGNAYATGTAAGKARIGPKLMRQATSIEEYIGHDLEFRAVSVHHWSKQIIEQAEEKFLSREAKVYDLEEHVIRPKGKDVICPRSVKEKKIKKGAAYVDCVHGADNVGLAVVMLSYTWGYSIGDIASGLEEYCAQRKLDPKRIYTWICCLCINQHRVKEAQDANESIPFEDFQKAFGDRVSGVGRIVALMTPWRDPTYIKRVWCDFELYTCMMHRDKDCQVAVTMPAAQKDDLIKNLCSGLGIDEMWKTLADLDVQQAQATYPEDKAMIMSIIEKSPKMDFHSVNSAVSKYLQTWIVHTCEEHLHTMLTERSSTTAMEKVMLQLNVGSLLRKIGRDDMSDRAAKYLSAASEALTRLEAQDPQNVPDVKTRVKLLHQLGCAQLQQGHKSEAKQSFHDAEKFVKDNEHDLLKSLDSVQLMMDMGAFHRKYKDNKKAAEYLEKAQSICDELGDQVPKLTRAELLRQVGDTKRRDEEYLPALVDLRKAQKLYQEVGCMDTPEGADLLVSIGVCLVEYRKEEEAQGVSDWLQVSDPLKVYQEARRIRELTSTLESPAGAKLLTSIGSVHRDREAWAEAKKHLEHAKNVFELTRCRSPSAPSPCGDWATRMLGCASGARPGMRSSGPA